MLFTIKSPDIVIVVLKAV
uniref:Uncharacterized protein n=1 Tax=Strongyloides stercoralis TaxID=6248 RepID=A0A0K0ENJ3_STRER